MNAQFATTTKIMELKNANIISQLAFSAILRSRVARVKRDNAKKNVRLVEEYGALPEFITRERPIGSFPLSQLHLELERRKNELALWTQIKCIQSAEKFQPQTFARAWDLAQNPDNCI